MGVFALGSVGLPELNTEKFRFAPRDASPNSLRGIGEHNMNDDDGGPTLNKPRTVPIKVKRQRSLPIAAVKPKKSEQTDPPEVPSSETSEETAKTNENAQKDKNEVQSKEIEDKTVKTSGNTPNKPLECPGTEASDGSAVALETVGQFHITMGWVFFLLFALVGCACFASRGNEGWGVVCIVIAIICLVRGYQHGAKDKATAKAAIAASKAAERTARMEQMLVNMVSGSDQVVVPSLAAQQNCPKCGAIIPATAKFCPECGAPTTAVCAKCGATLTASAKFCSECGAKCE